MKRRCLKIFAGMSCALFLVYGASHDSVSATYTAVRSAITAGGGASASPGYKLTGAIGQTAIGPAGSTSYGNLAGLFTPGTEISPPGVPTITTVTIENGTATVTFTPPSSDGGSAITGYTVTSLPAGGVDQNAGSTLLTHVITGLASGTSYTFTVTATNADGTSVVSSAAGTVAPPTMLYTFTGTASGSVGGVSFNNAPLTISVAGSSDDVGYNPASGTYYLDRTPAISIGGVGSGVITAKGAGVTTTLSGSANYGSAVSFHVYPTPGALVRISDPSFASWDLKSAIGPVSAPSPILSADLFQNIASTLGPVSVTALSNVTFSATPITAPTKDFYADVAGSFDAQSTASSETADISVGNETVQLNATGALTGTQTVTISRAMNITSGTYAGWGIKVGTYAQGDYHGTVYIVTSPTMWWGSYNGDITGAYTYDLTTGKARISLTSIRGVKTPGAVELGGVVVTDPGTWTSYPAQTFSIHQGTTTETAAGYYTGKVTRTLKSIHLTGGTRDGFAIGTYSSEWGSGNIWMYTVSGSSANSSNGMYDGPLFGTRSETFTIPTAAGSPVAARMEFVQPVNISTMNRVYPVQSSTVSNDSADLTITTGGTLSLQATGLISGDLTMTLGRGVSISSGRYSGWGYRVYSYQIGGYSGTLYLVTTPGKWWGEFTGDIHGVHVVDRAGGSGYVAVSSIRGVKTTGVINLTVTGSTPGASTFYPSYPLIIRGSTNGSYTETGTFQGYLYDGSFAETGEFVSLAQAGDPVGDGFVAGTYTSDAGAGNFYNYLLPLVQGPAGADGVAPSIRRQFGVLNGPLLGILSQSYTIPMQENSVFSATFESVGATLPDSPTITQVTSGNDSATVSFSVPATDGGSAITSYTVTATPTGGGTTVTVSGTSSPITVTGLTNGVGYTFTVAATNAAGTGATSTASDTVTPNAPVNGVCGSAAGLTFTSLPAAYLCTAGTTAFITGSGPWTWSCVGLYGGTTADCSANAQTYIVTASAGPSGSLAAGTPSPQTVYFGGTTSFTFNASAGYHVASISGCGISYSNASNAVTTYSATTGAITSACTVSATFATNAYTVTPSAGAYGSITPSLPQAVNYNSTASFTVIPNSGYEIAQVVGCGGALSGNTYTSDAIRGDCTVNASFTGSQPAIVTPPSSELNFGKVNVASSSLPKAVTVRNNGKGVLNIASVTTSGSPYFKITADTCSGASLSYNASCTVKVVFAPATTGVQNFNLLIASNDPSTPSKVPLTGEGVASAAPQISVSAGTVDFGAVGTGSSSAGQSVTVMNSGSADLLTGSITLSGDPDFSTAADTCSNKTLPPGTTCSVKALFKPAVQGARGATLTIPSNDTGNPSAAVALAGTGAVPQIPLISLSPLSADFGTVSIGSSPTRVITVKNSGTADLAVTGLSYRGSADLSIAGDSCSGTIVSPSSYCTVLVQYVPQSATTVSGAITVSSNDPYTPNATVTLDGTGASVPKPHLEAYPATIRFYLAETAGTVSVQTVTIKNSGTGNLVLGQVRKDGADASAFSIANDTCSGMTVSPLSACSFDVVYGDTLPGTRTASVSVPSNDPDMPLFSIPLSGTTSAPQEAVIAATGADLKNITVTDSAAGMSNGIQTTDMSLSFKAVNVISSATFSFTFDSLSTKPVFYKLVNGSVKQLYPVNECNGTSNVTLSGNTLSFTLADNSECDADPTPGVIVDPLVVATDLVGESGTSNNPPTISGTPSGTVAAGSPYSFTPTASDPDGDALTFSIANKPSWAAFNSATGTLSGTPPAAGTYNYIVISVSDGHGGDASLPTFSISVTAVNHSPVISGTPTASGTAGAWYAFTPNASDPDGDQLTFSISNKPAWATFSAVTGMLSGTPGPGDAGTYSNIQISVSDGVLATTLPVFSITVASGSGGTGGTAGDSGPPKPVPVMDGWWLLPGVLAGVGIFARRRKGMNKEV